MSGLYKEPASQLLCSVCQTRPGRRDLIRCSECSMNAELSQCNCTATTTATLNLAGLGVITMTAEPTTIFWLLDTIRGRLSDTNTESLSA